MDRVHAPILARWEEFGINSPFYFPDALQKEINARDIGYLTNRTVEYINVTTVHPILEILANNLQGTKTEKAGVLPRVGVSFDSSNDTSDRLMGYGKHYFGMTPALLEEAQDPDKVFDRVKKSYASDSDKGKIMERLMRNNPDNLALKVERQTRTKEDTVMVSFWDDSKMRYDALRSVVVACLESLQEELRDNEVTDFSIRTTGDLTNTSFGRLVFGQESVLTFKNRYYTYIVYDEFVRTDFKAEVTINEE